MSDLGQLIGELGEAIDHAALDPAQWPCVLDTVCASLPGANSILHIADTRGGGAIGVLQRGFDDGLMADYERHYAKLNPWVPFLIKAPVLQALVADERHPASSFRESEFYRDWMLRDREMESSTGIKLVHEADRMGLLAVHYSASPGGGVQPPARAPATGECGPAAARGGCRAAGAQEGGADSASVARRLRPASPTAGRARSRACAQPAGAGADWRTGAVARARQCAPALRRSAVGARRGHRPADRGGPGAMVRRRRSGPHRQGWKSVHALLAPRTRDAVVGVPAFIAPERLTLLVVRPSADRNGAGQTLLHERFGLTPAERRLALRLAAGLSLRQSADRLGIAYNTARAQLRAVFSKTGTSRQGELVALMARVPDVDGRG